ncbi:MAG: TPM domain-containing protein [Desulfobacterales bacterium]|nr:TPM domain-containing protein [Desulfobacterales bacterium]
MRFPTTSNSKHSLVFIFFFWALLTVDALCQNPLHALEAQGPDGGGAAVSQDYAPFPQPGTGYVTDLAHLLGIKKEERIEQWLWQIEKKTGIEIVVVTLASIQDYPGTPNDSIESFATALFNRYGIGNLPANNGILLLVAREDRKARIELGTGYGHDKDPDAMIIMRDVIISEFKNNDYAAGITNGVKALALEFADIRIGPNWPLIIAIIAVVLFFIIGFSLLFNGKKGWGWVFVGLGVIVLLFVIHIVIIMIRSSPGKSGSWSSGGLGGFGGGSSGGGGASGSW